MGGYGPCRGAAASGVTKGLAGVLLVICSLWQVHPTLAQSRRDTYDAARRGLATIDSLLAVPAASAAVDRARDLWLTVGDDPVYGWQVESRLGLALLLADEPKAALPHLESVARQQPGEALHHRNLGAALIQLRRRGRALAEYRTAVELAPDNPDLRRELGQLLLAFGDTKQAARELAVARRLCGGCPELDQPLASLYLREKDYTRAVAPLARLFERDPRPAIRQTLVAALANAGQDSSLMAVVGTVPPGDRSEQEWRLLVEAEGRFGGQAHSLLAATALTAGDTTQVPEAVLHSAPFWGQVALNLLVAGQYLPGLAAVDQAVALEPREIVYRNNRVVLLQRLGREAAARQEWQRVQDLESGQKQENH